MWIVLAFVATLGWAFEEFFVKKASPEENANSQYQIAVITGFWSLFTMYFVSQDIEIEDYNLFTSVWEHKLLFLLPLSTACAAIVNNVGYRYLNLSVMGPVQGAADAFPPFMILVSFLMLGKLNSVWDRITPVSLACAFVIMAGIIGLAVVQNRLAAGKEGVDEQGNRASKYGAFAFVFPLIYCVFDAGDSVITALLLDEKVENSMSEEEFLMIYGVGFIVVGLISWIYMLIKDKKPYNPFKKSEGFKHYAVLCTVGAQLCYTYATAKNSVVTAAIVATTGMFTILASKLILKEKIVRKQWICIVVILVAMFIIGLLEGLSGNKAA